METSRTSLRALIFACGAPLASSVAQAAPPSQIAELRPGAPVSIEGVVERILDEDEFMLRDPSGSIEVYLETGHVALEPGDRVSVRGMLDDEGLRPEFYARSVSRIGPAQDG